MSRIGWLQHESDQSKRTTLRPSHAMLPRCRSPCVRVLGRPQPSSCSTTDARRGSAVRTAAISAGLSSSRSRLVSTSGANTAQVLASVRSGQSDSSRRRGTDCICRRARLSAAATTEYAMSSTDSGSGAIISQPRSASAARTPGTAPAGHPAMTSVIRASARKIFAAGSPPSLTTGLSATSTTAMTSRQSVIALVGLVVRRHDVARVGLARAAQRGPLLRSRRAAPSCVPGGPPR